MTTGPLRPDRRVELETWLGERAELLKPSAEVVRKALQRCVRHDRRSGRLDALEEVVPVTPPADQALGTDLLPDGIPSAVAAAPTVPEQSAVSMTPPSGAKELPPVSKTPALQANTEIAGYRIGGVLGSGGMGQVYEATQISMNRTVAFKVLAPRLADNSNFRNRFIREARNAGRLQHPNLIAVHDVGEAGKMLFFSMELVSGESVGDIIKREGRLDEARALAIASQVLDALAYAHENGLVHRDIKPDNLMVTENGTVKVADLGLSRGMEDGVDGSTTQSGTMMGTPFYMPPEQGRDAHSADHRSDIYALGASLYHMICGRVPYTGRTAVEVVLNATTKALAFPDVAPPSNVVRKLLGKLMAKQPDDRPQNAAEAMELVERSLGILTRGGSTDSLLHRGERSGYVAPMPQSALRRLLPWIFSALVAVILLGALVFFIGRNEGRQQWELQRTLVDEALMQENFRLARDSIDSFRRSFPQAADWVEVTTLRRQTVERWNQYAQDHVDPQLEQVHELLSAYNYAEAAERLRRIAGDVKLGSPATQARVSSEMEQLVAAEQRTWENCQQKVNEHVAGGQYRAAVNELKSFLPDTQSLRDAHRQRLAELEPQAGEEDAAAPLRRWFEKMRGKFVSGEGSEFRFVKTGHARLPDLVGNPDELSFTMAFKIPPGGVMNLGIELSRQGRRIVRLSDGKVQIVKMSSDRETLRRGFRDRRIPKPLEEGEVLYTAERHGEIKVHVHMTQDRIRMEVENMRGHPLMTDRLRGVVALYASWQAREEPIRMRLIADSPEQE